MNITEHSNTVYIWKTGLVPAAVSLNLLAIAIIFACYLRANPYAFYASSAASAISLGLFSFFVVRSCKSYTTRKKIEGMIRDNAPASPPQCGGKVPTQKKPTIKVPAKKDPPKVVQEPVNPVAKKPEEPEPNPLPEPGIIVGPVIPQDPIQDKDQEPIAQIDPPGIIPQENPAPVENKPEDPVPVIIPLNEDASRKKVVRQDSLNSKPILLRKHKIKKLEGIQTKKIKEGEAPAKQGTSWDIFSLFKAPFKVMADYLMSGGPLQQRVYYHLLSSLLDPIFSFLDMPVAKSAPVIEKVNILLFNLGSKHWAKFKFLADEKSCNTSFQYHLHLAFMTLIQVANPKQNYATLRYNFFQHINAAYEEYKKDIAAFRAMDKEKARQEYPEMALLQAIGFAIFTEARLTSYAHEAVFSSLQQGNNKYGEAPARDVRIDTLIHEDHESLARIPQDQRGGFTFQKANQAMGHANINFSPMDGKNNFSSQYWRSHYSLGDKSHSMTCLRFGTPTSENYDNPEILPSMTLFLDYCAQNDLKIASFQHQNPEKKGHLKGDESKRYEKMFELSLKQEYRKVFHAFGLPMDGDFFFQKGPYSKQEAAIDFIKSFYSQMMNEKGDSLIRLPLDLFKDEFPNAKEELAQLVDQIHKLFFGKKESLTVDERMLFQLITYAHLVEYFSLGLEVDFFHCQCKDAQDRTVVLLGILKYLSLIRSGKDEDSCELNTLRSDIEFACLMNKGMPLHDHRFPQLEKGLHFLSNLTPSEKKIIRETPLTVKNQKTFLKEVISEEVPNQTLHPLPSEALTLDEYFSHLEAEVARCSDFGFKIPYFVQNFFDVPDKKGYVEGLVRQFRVKDVPRQHYLIGGKKILVPSFHDGLKKLVQEHAPGELKGEKLEKLVEEITKLEETHTDPQVFCKALKINEKKWPRFTESVRNLYHDLRAKALEELAFSWAENDQEKAFQILALSQQGILMDVTSALEQKYKFVSEGLGNTDLQNMRTEISETVQIFQKEPNGTSNTCFNYVLEIDPTTQQTRRIIEAYQYYEITQGEKKTLYYVITKTRINLETGEAAVLCLPPRKEAPQDITTLVQKMNLSADELANSFIL